MEAFISNISDDDRNRMNSKRNPPQYESGFESDDFSNDGDFSDIFGDTDDFDSGFGSDGFGSGNAFGSNDVFGNAGFSSFDNGFGNNTFGNNAFGNNYPNQNNNNMAQQEQQEPEMIDKAIEYAIESGKDILVVFKELLSSLKLRNADDVGHFATKTIQAGGGVAVGSLVGLLVGALARFNIIVTVAPELLVSGIMTFGTGISTMGVSALVLMNKADSNEMPSLDSIPEIQPSENNLVQEYEQANGAIMDNQFNNDLTFDDDLFSDDDLDSFWDELEDDDDTPSLSGVEELNENKSTFESEVDNSSEQTSFNLGMFTRRPDVYDNVIENQHMSREVLYSTFKPLLPHMTPNFADREEITQGHEYWEHFENACISALSEVLKVEIDDVDSELISAYITFFAYELRIKRPKGMNKVEQLERELEYRFRKSARDLAVKATVDIEGSFFKIIISKGETAVVTLGDIFAVPYCEEFFLDSKNRFPLILGINELGEVILEDAKTFDSMMICGKPRSGKSWYVGSTLMCLTMFNSPEDLQILIIDPKETTFFNTMSLLPHICGLHNGLGGTIFEILDDIIEVEAPRRKQILSDNRCDDIWAARKKGIKMPVLIVFVDEYITICNNVGDDKKELDKKIQIIMTQFPSLGIRIMIVSHRTTGIVDKTNRSMLSFIACVKGEIELVKESLGITKWERSLVNKGDIVFKSPNIPEATYARGSAITIDDTSNCDLIREVARIFYKMGVDLPDMSALKVACNRNPEHIRNELQSDLIREQYTADAILEDDD